MILTLPMKEQLKNNKTEKKIKEIMNDNPLCNPHPFSKSVKNILKEKLGINYQHKLHKRVVVKNEVMFMDLENGDKCIIVPFNFIGKKLLFVERVLGVGHTMLVRNEESGEVIKEVELKDDLFYPFVYPNDKPLNISVNKEKRNGYVKSIGLPKDVEQSSLMK